MALKNFFFLTSMLFLSFWASALAGDRDYSRNTNRHKTNLQEEKLLSTMIGIQGLIYCRSGSKLTPLEGAVARIACQGVDEYGYEAESVSILSSETDAKGYFIATLSPYEVKENLRLTECRAFLELSPSETCGVPTDVNNGISGAPLGFYHLLNDKNIKFFTVGPFFFVPQQDAESISDGY